MTNKALQKDIADAIYEAISDYIDDSIADELLPKINDLAKTSVKLYLADQDGDEDSYEEDEYLDLQEDMDTFLSEDDE
jgi:hypothetical protein